MMGLGMVKKCWWWGWKAMSSCCTLVINNWDRVCCKKWVHYRPGFTVEIVTLFRGRLSHSLKEDFHITHHRKMVTSKKILGKTCHHILPSTRHSQVENLVTFEALFQISSQGVSDHDRYLWRCSTTHVFLSKTLEVWTQADCPSCLAVSEYWQHAAAAIFTKRTRSQKCIFVYHHPKNWFEVNQSFYNQRQIWIKSWTR